MPCVHCVEEVEGLAAADLADDDSIGGHSQRLVDQHLDRDGTTSLRVGRPPLQRDAVGQLAPEMQLGLVFDRDDTLVGSDEAGQHAHECRLSGARTA